MQREEEGAEKKKERPRYWKRARYAAAGAAAGRWLEKLLLCGFDPICGRRRSVSVGEFADKLLRVDDLDDFPSGARLSAAARERLAVLSFEPWSLQDWRDRVEFGELLTICVLPLVAALPAAPVNPAFEW